ncbi:hypothetical protein [Vibrio phage vB_VhaS-a]|nr:hypothetical protein [Vibrio phage vB_VhaS-a]
MENVKATLVVDLQNVTDRSVNGGELVLEFDRREGGLNKRSQPLFTESAYFLLYPYKASNFEISPSSGSASFTSNSGTLTEEETVIFNNSNTARLSKPAASIVSVQWLGASGGVITAEGSRLEIPDAGNFVAVISYRTDYQVIRLTPPNLDSTDFEEYVINLSVSAEVSS